MNIGEKIQFYRKQNNMSQENLAIALNLSRQTISLWETSQTVPTIDNLIRLSEIFTVSVDELIKGESVANTEKTNETETPREKYTFNFDDKDEKAVTKTSRAPLVRAIIIFSTAFVLVSAYLVAVAQADNYVVAFLLGMLVLGIFVYTRSLTSFNKREKEAFTRIKTTTYDYELYQDYMVLKLSRENELLCTQKMYYKDIKNGINSDNHILYVYGNQLFFVRKSDLSENSVFYNFIKTKTGKIKDTQKAYNTHRTLSIVLFILSLVSILLGITLVGYVSSLNYMFTENMWLMFLFTPITIGSTVYGFILKKKGYKYKKNIITGIIMTIVLCIYGSFTFMFADTYTHTDKPIKQVEEALDIDLPQHAQINTNTMEDSFENGIHLRRSDVYFKDEDVYAFEQGMDGIAWDEKWLNRVPNDLKGIMSPFFSYTPYDCVVVYNITEDEINTLPVAAGTYTMLNIAYDASENHMVIEEYVLMYQPMNNTVA